MTLLYLFKKIFKRQVSLQKKNSWQAASFIGPGEAVSKRAPGDHIGTSYFFDIYDWANGVYHYEV